MSHPVPLPERVACADTILMGGSDTSLGTIKRVLDASAGITNPAGGTRISSENIAELSMSARVVTKMMNEGGATIFISPAHVKLTVRL